MNENQTFKQKLLNTPLKHWLKSIQVAILIGSILTLINQWRSFVQGAPFDWVSIFLTYQVPFIVYNVGYFSRSSSPEMTLEQVKALLVQLEENQQKP